MLNWFPHAKHGLGCDHRHHLTDNDERLPVELSITLNGKP